jgi:hypothetical protein
LSDGVIGPSGDCYLTQDVSDQWSGQIPSGMVRYSGGSTVRMKIENVTALLPNRLKTQVQEYLVPSV